MTWKRPMVKPIIATLFKRISCNPIPKLTENPSNPNATDINNKEPISPNWSMNIKRCPLVLACTIYANGQGNMFEHQMKDFSDIELFCLQLFQYDPSLLYLHLRLVGIHKLQHLPLVV